MNVLVVTTLYDESAPSGENRVFQAEVRLLRNAGHIVQTYQLSNQATKRWGLAGLLYAFLVGFWNCKASREVLKIVKENQIEVVHVHNTFPLLSLSVMQALKSIHAVKVVHTLHNYRLLCIRGTPFRLGKVCVECLQRGNPIFGLLHRCYRNSFFAGLPSFFNALLFKYVVSKRPHRFQFLALTEFQRNILRRSEPFSRLPIAVKPNFIENTLPFDAMGGRQKVFLFIGRFSEEKGILMAIQAWKDHPIRGYKLVIAGSGPQVVLIENEVKGRSDILLYGKLSSAEVLSLMRTARFFLFTSVWFETFGLTIVEAFSVGTPVLATKLGSNGSIVNDGTTGFLFEPWDPKSFIAVMQRAALLSDFDYEEMSRRCREDYVSRYSPDVGLRQLVRIYENE